MNKSLIYSYICQLEKEMLWVLSYNQFARLIVSEIVNETLIQLHELKGGLSTDGKTAKDLICRNINQFYTPVYLSKVEDKLCNWDNRVCYGYRGRFAITPKGLAEFKIATNTSIKHVEKEKEELLNAVRNSNFKSESTSKHNVKQFLLAGIIGTILITLASIGIYCYSISNRYQRINASTVFDNWTGKSINVFENRETEELYGTERIYKNSNN